MARGSIKKRIPSSPSLLSSGAREFLLLSNLSLIYIIVCGAVQENSRGGAAESIDIHNRRFRAAIMMIGVVLLVGYMMFSNKRVSSTSSYSKQMKVNFWEHAGEFLEEFGGSLSGVRA
ncbi:hypothetical protein Q3G72_024008 [Acer saccharum]|nr:hypothetical protein Q3G72_024008 [Acer saccharum]